MITLGPSTNVMKMKGFCRVTRPRYSSRAFCGKTSYRDVPDYAKKYSTVMEREGRYWYMPSTYLFDVNVERGQAIRDYRSIRNVDFCEFPKGEDGGERGSDGRISRHDGGVFRSSFSTSNYRDLFDVVALNWNGKSVWNLDGTPAVNIYECYSLQSPFTASDMYPAYVDCSVLYAWSA